MHLSLFVVVVIIISSNNNNNLLRGKVDEIGKSGKEPKVIECLY